MATHLIMIISVLLSVMGLQQITSTSSTTTAVLESSPRADQEIITAIGEMQSAGYFTFVTLLNMVQDINKDTHGGNTTFLMPNDRSLSEASIPEEAVTEFLSRHSIPSSLLFGDMEHLPSGTMIPTNLQNYLLTVRNDFNHGSFFLNDVRVVGRDICSAAAAAAGTSIRCHGIDGVLPTNGTSSSGPAPDSGGGSQRPGGIGA